MNALALRYASSLLQHAVILVSMRRQVSGPHLAGAFLTRWLGNSPSDIRKQAVDIVQGLWCLDGKVRPLPNLAQVQSRCGSAEAIQNQVVVCDVPCISD